MKRFWMSVAVICIACAGVALWFQHYDAGFVFATLGALSWFLNYRVSAKEAIGETNNQDDEDEESSGSRD